MGELEFGLIEIGERFAEVDQHEVALVADEREQCGLAGRILLHRRQGVGCFFGDGRLLGGGQGAPGGPAQAHHLVQNAVAFGSERDGRDFRGDFWTRLVSGRHASPLFGRCFRGNGFKQKEILYAVLGRPENREQRMQP